MKYSVVLDRLQNLINYTPSQSELCKITGVKQSTMSVRSSRDSDFTSDEIVMISNYYGINLFNNVETKDSVTIDYYPDVFGSCGNGVFVASEHKEQIQVLINALFKSLSKGKQYSVINATGNSMQPLFYDKDKLIVEHWNGEQIIDNKPYIFCYKDEIFIKRLAKNVDQLMIISDNKDYDTRKLTGEQLKDVSIIGLVVGLMRDFR